MKFAEAILENPGVLQSLIDKFNEGRQYLLDTLDANGYEHKGEAGNFLFIKVKTDAESIVRTMKTEKRILIKSYPNVGTFGTCLRVSIGEQRFMKQFCDALFDIDK
jgi:histidinol-phosphate aminotransferase